MTGAGDGIVRVRGAGAHRALRAAARACAALALAACALTGAGCAQATVDGSSPRVVDVQLKSSSSMTEQSQEAQIKLVFDQQISASGSVADDFELLLNGAAVDTSVIKVEARASADSVTFTLRPADGASAGVGAGSYFALYQSGFSLSSARDDGALPHITGASGACAVLGDAVWGTLPSGLAIEVAQTRAGSAEAGVPAQTVFRVTSPATVRAITWFSPDGGATKLLKHNHTFASSDAAAAAADLAEVVNAASGLGVTATARGDEVTLTAASVADGQVIEPCVVEGVGVEGGVYDASSGGGA